MSWLRGSAGFVLALALAACAPRSPDPGLEPARLADADDPAIAPWLLPPERSHTGAEAQAKTRDVAAVPGSPLLVVQSAAAVSGHRVELVVYEDGRAFVHERGGFGSAPERTFSRALPLGLDELAALRSLLASEGYRGADDTYSEEGVKDGGAVALYDAISQREVRVINRPPNLPEELAEVRATIDELHARIVDEGRDPFVDTTVPGLGILAMHSLLWDDANESRDLVVYADGSLELCGAERPYDLGHGLVPCRVGFISVSRLVPLRARLEALATSDAEPTTSDAARAGIRTRLTHSVRAAGRDGWLDFDDRSGVPPELAAVMVELAMLRYELEDA